MICAVYARKSQTQPGVADDAKSVPRQLAHARTYIDRKGWRGAGLGLLAVLAMPLVADAAPRHRSDSGYRSRSGYSSPYRARYWPSSGYYGRGYSYGPVQTIPGNGSFGAPLHGLVCSKGTIAELPPERQALYTDGATVGFPGQRCLDFSQQ